MMFALLPALMTLVAPIEVTIDKYGVPSIFAQSDADAAYALGYEQAMNCGDQMAASYKIARGRYAEVVGQKQILTDEFIRSLGLEDAAEEASQNPPGDPTVIDAFLQGANRAIAERKTKGNVGTWIAPFTRTDVYALFQLLMIGFPLMDLQSKLSSAGSNQFAVSPQRSSTGHPIVSLDPHLSLEGGDLVIWFEFSKYTPTETFHGVSVPGLPFAVMGHNDRVAWSMTNNDPALMTRFKVVANPVDASEYSYHGEWRKFGSKTLKMSYLAGGELKSFSQTTRTTAWGPLIPFRNEAVACPLIGRFTGLNDDAIPEKAVNVADFRRRMAKHGTSMWNFVFADVDGNIGYQYNATLPARNPDFHWRGVVPGDKRETKLGDLISYEDLPHVVNPRSGFLVNCNSSPWLTATSGEISDKWPDYITTYGETTRYDRLWKLLSEDARVSLDKAKTYATDTVAPYGKQTAKALITAGADPAAAKILDAWDGRAESKSVGCALYVYWLIEDKANHDLTVAAGTGRAWRPDQQKAAIASLQSAEAKLVKDHGRLDVPWGDVLYLQRGKFQVPSGGYGYVSGSISAVRPTSGVWSNGKMRANFGSSMRMIVSLVPGHVHSWSVLPYGNSWVPDSPHYSDQMSLYAEGKYKETNFGAAAARRAAREHLTLKRADGPSNQ